MSVVVGGRGGVGEGSGRGRGGVGDGSGRSRGVVGEENFGKSPILENREFLKIEFAWPILR